MAEVYLADLSDTLHVLLEEEGNYEAGFALGRHILHYYPRHLRTYAQLGLASLQIGYYADAADLLRRALSAHPEAGQLWVALQSAATHLGLDDEAAIAADYAADLLAETVDAKSRPVPRAIDAAARQQWSLALGHYLRAYRQEPHRMDAALGVATTLLRIQRYHDCRLMTETILDELPYCLKANWLMVRCAYELEGEDLDANAYLRTARTLDPDDLYAWGWFGHPEGKAPQPKSQLPAWSDDERWSFDRQSSE